MRLLPYHRECAQVAKRDPRWARSEVERCEACGEKVDFAGPDGEPRHPWCWPWEWDDDAPARPQLPRENLPLPDCPKVHCPECGNHEPVLTWRLAGKKTKVWAIAAACPSCKRWVRWCDAAIFGGYAPPAPPDEAAPALFGEPPEEEASGGYVDTSMGGKRAKRELPPPEGAILRKSVTKFAEALAEASAHLYLDAEGRLRSTIPWRLMPEEVSETILADQARAILWLTCDVEWQLRAARTRPHIVTVVSSLGPERAAEDERRIALWRRAEVSGWRFEDWSDGEPGDAWCRVCGRSCSAADAAGVRRHPWCGEEPDDRTAPVRRAAGSLF